MTITAEQRAMLGLDKPMTDEQTAVVDDFLSDKPKAPPIDWSKLRFSIIHDGTSFSLKDYDHPMHKASRPMFLRDRFMWVGPLREDYTRYATREDAEAAIAEYVGLHPDMAGKLRVSPTLA